MARKIFNGISINLLTEKEISEIKNSDIIDRIISNSYYFIDDDLEKEPGKNIASYLPVTWLSNKDKVKQPVEEIYSERMESHFESRKAVSTNFFEAFPVFDDVVNIAKTEAVPTTLNMEKVA
ncbi:hypothetical protein [Leuconostoc lactis]|uniref:hypothetical protein n=1 Tax=Leuconostoc lactis TaxID=1246 RepID=UPI0011BB87B3|nr:hypothetical protein [Leuconostoc lactis]QEA50856.1 hypothetical protein FGL78_04115 [Leuconostoc lactis]